jgi:hypothetical protein
MRRSLGIISGAFALRNRAFALRRRTFALGGQAVFSFFERHFGSIPSRVQTPRA